MSVLIEVQKGVCYTDCTPNSQVVSASDIRLPKVLISEHIKVQIIPIKIEKVNREREEMCMIA